MAIKNMAASVLTRLKNQSKEEGIPFQMVLQLFAQEEFLRKLSLSKYADSINIFCKNKKTLSEVSFCFAKKGVNNIILTLLRLTDIL